VSLLDFARPAGPSRREGQEAALSERGGTQRWEPSRAGIVNVWRYYDETFTFHRGRLLLRGQNGSGKSKALEVLLPFLLDANLRPSRLSTFGGSERTMHWNLMGEGASGTTRVGYVWLEFTTGSDRDRRWFSCGARLQASAHTSGVQADYFTTGQRIGEPAGLPLVNPAGQPLTRAALAEAVAGHGVVHGSAADYRTAIRGALFPGLSEQRYDALITALLQLRTPKLSERLDPSLLSALLSRALPPLGQAEIAELAEGFERLDRQREHLGKLDDEVRAAGTLASRQRGYAQRVLRAGAAALVSATTDMDNLTRQARESEQAHQAAQRDRASADDQRKDLDRRTGELEASIEGLIDSDVYRKGQELDQLRRRAEAAGQEAARKEAAAAGAIRAADEDATRTGQAQQRCDRRAGQARAARRDAEHAARRAGLASVHSELEQLLGPAGAAGAAADQPAGTPADQLAGTPADPLAGRPTDQPAGRPTDQPAGRPTDQPAGPDHAQLARRLLRGAVDSRQRQITEVRAAIDRHDRAVADRTTAEEALDEARALLSAANERRDATTRAYDTEVGEQEERLRRWAQACLELRFEDLDGLAARAGSEAEVLASVEAATRGVERELTEAETTTLAARADARSERDALRAEIDRLAGDIDVPPDPPRTRTADRSTMPGAPLWRLVAFHDDVPPAIQSGVEAALQASGALDAWVAPSGAIELPGHDTQLRAWTTGPAPARSLVEVLRPESDGPVAADRVQGVLATIAYGPTLPADHPAAVGADGSWRMAGITGTWSKDEAAHIGTVARERARRRRIAELTMRLDEITSVVAELDGRLLLLAGRRDNLAADRRTRPDHQRLDAARRAADRAASDVAARDDAVRAAMVRLTAREVEAHRALGALTAVAAERGLPADGTALTDLAAAVQALRDIADSWLDAQQAWEADLRTVADRREQAARSRRVADERVADGESAHATAAALAAMLAAVQSTVGEDYRQVAIRISALRADLAKARGDRRELDTEVERLAEYLGSLSTKLAEDACRRDVAVDERNSVADRFRRLVAHRLPDDAGIVIGLTDDDGVRATLDAARAVAARWPDLPHTPRSVGDALSRLTEAVHVCRQDLSERADLALEPTDDVQLFTASIDGLRLGATALLAALTVERDRSQDDITAAERELFDKTLTGDTRRHLAARIRQANELVDRMNGHLERVRTASKVAVRLVWQIHPDLPPGTRTARELLLKDPVRITETDREALHAFFRGRIADARSRNTAASWEEQLSEVLDYTAWHQFVVKLDNGNGSGWQLLTKKLHGALSGGEKAVALHLPLFAAVAAHYQAVPEAPRMILLDEVFVGVDATNRGQIFSLLDALDLDLLLTSDHEWCLYRELPGIAIHQLITGDDGDDAVTSARFVWNGAELTPDDGELLW
jgi:uncharacterized protein (TIGR02680 family)